MTPGETVTAFITALTAGDLEGAAALCHEDLVFENVPIEGGRQEGRESILAGLVGLISSCEKVEWEVPFQVESGRHVVNERIDRFSFDDGVEVGLPVMGRFDVGDDGRIVLWRDYFDMAMFDRPFEGGFAAYMGRRAAAS